jgi:hypothetical protein
VKDSEILLVFVESADDTCFSIPDEGGREVSETLATLFTLVIRSAGILMLFFPRELETLILLFIHSLPEAE